ncbi:Peptidase family S58 [compost metagenome]
MAFSVGNSDLPVTNVGRPGVPTTTVQMVNNDHISALFSAAADAVEEAILNAMLAATDLQANGQQALALKPEQLLEALHTVGWKADPRAAERS